jgi:hypothetical protein
MRIVTTVVAEETYTFTPDDGTEPISIRSGRLREWLLENAQHKVIELTFPAQSLREIEVMHGLERPRMRSMTKAEALEPVIVGLWPNGTHILIDGGHRRWFWAKRKKFVLRGWAVPTEVWSTFIFDPNDPAVVVHHADGSLLPQRRQG